MDSFGIPNTYRGKAWERVAHGSFKAGSKLICIWFWSMFLNKHFIMKTSRRMSKSAHSQYKYPFHILHMEQVFCYIIRDLFPWKMHALLDTYGVHHSPNWALRTSFCNGFGCSTSKGWQKLIVIAPTFYHHCEPGTHHIALLRISRCPGLGEATAKAAVLEQVKWGKGNCLLARHNGSSQEWEGPSDHSLAWGRPGSG